MSAYPLPDRLPVELLADILLHTCATDSVLDYQLSVPVILSSVCRRWREVALKTQKLWQRIDPASDAPGLPLTTLFLQRASSCDLYIDLNYVKPPTNAGVFTLMSIASSERSRVEEAFDLLSPHIRRWSVLNLTVLFPGSLGILQGRLLHAPRLKDLHMNCLGVTFEGSQASMPSIVLHPDATPALDALFLQGVEPHVATGSYLPEVKPVPTEMTLAWLPRCAPSALARVFSHFNIHDLELTGLGIFNQMTDPITLPNLKKLSIIHLENPADIVPLMELIRAPHLDELHIRDYSHEFACAKILRTLTRSKSSYTSISRLVLHSGPLAVGLRHPSAHDWFTFFLHHNRIEALFVNNMTYNMKPMFIALTDIYQGQFLLPKLCFLGLRNAIPLDLLVFLDTLGSRPRRAKNLILNLQGVDPFDDSDLLTVVSELLGDWGELDLTFSPELECSDDEDFLGFEEHGEDGGDANFDDAGSDFSVDDAPPASLSFVAPHPSA